ncbi:MAG: PKD domain-containing protein [Thermoplasmata archaeon]
MSIRKSHSVLTVTILLCAMMILVGFAQLSTAQDWNEHVIVKGDKGPRASAVTWQYTPGQNHVVWSGKVLNNGLRSLTIEVYDNTSGIPEKIYDERIRFAQYDAYPTGVVMTSQVLMAANHIYEITATPNGPKGSSATVIDVGKICPSIEPFFTYVIDGLTVTVDASATSDPDGVIANYDWEWGDGTYGTGVIASHTYSVGGDYTITLTITDVIGLTYSRSETVHVEAQMPPVAQFTYTASYLTVTVDASGSYDPDGYIVTYEWNWGDGTGEIGAPVMSHTYAAYGVYIITLTVTDDDGLTGSATSSYIPPPNIPPVASFAVSVEGLSVSVDASASYDVDGVIVSYSWSWGDSRTGSGVMASHTYAWVGTYSIRLTVTDNYGLTNSVTKRVNSTSSLPIASFTYDVDGLTINVDASGSYDPTTPIVNYAWDWGDGTVGSGIKASHTYSSAGKYEILLVVTDEVGGSDSFSDFVLVGSETTISYTISNMFEHYLKPTDYTKLGRWGSQMGINSWYDLRRNNYGDWIVRNTYPFVLGTLPYSTQTYPDKSVGPLLSTWYRMYIDANNLPNPATGPNKDPIFVPMPDANKGMVGGWVNITWYSTYMMDQELRDLRANGIHYGNFYYGVPLGVTPSPYLNDGHLHELQGHVSFTRDACKKFLGLTAAGDLEDEFNANKALIEKNWFDDWMAEGGGGGRFDIYTAYDYSLDIRYLRLIVDPKMGNTDPDTLYLRFYAISWGTEVFLMRYLEAAGLLPGWQPWPDDFYLNATIGPDGADIDVRAVMGYHMIAWADLADPTKAAWALEAVHIDWCGNTITHKGYPSPFNQYDPDQIDATRTSWAPGTVNFGGKVSYWITPMELDLAAGQKLTVKLTTYSKIVGYTPYKATSDILDAAKVAEWNSKSYFGDAALGTGWPGDLSSYYDPATNTVTLIGPIDFPRLPNPDYPELLETGSPTIIINIV